MSVCLSRFPISTPFMHSATPQEDFVCGFGVREEGREGGEAQTVLSACRMQCKHASKHAVMMTMIAPHGACPYSIGQ